MIDGDATPGSDATTARAAGTIPPDIAGLTFDAALDEFQRTVAALETGGQPLEEALVLYERGVALHAHLDRLLTDAELRIRRLVERAGGVETGDVRDDAG